MNQTASSQPRTSPLAGLLNHPPAFWFFFWGELAERSSYYGMRAILALYMVDIIGFTKGQSSMAMSVFIAACYFLPLIGGWLADRYFGKYWIIVGFSIPYILGHVILGFENVYFLVAALALLAMGSGVIKPNISTLMGLTYDQQRPGEEKLRSDAFAMFYFAINLGAFASSFAMPLIRDQYGYAIAFLFPTVLMVIAFAIFAAGKPFYAVEVIRRTPTTPEERREQRLVLTRLGAIFLVVSLFWSIFDQSASTWTLFARDHLDLNIFGRTIPADMIQSVNPLLIMILLPPITILWRVLANVGLNLRPTDKMMIGFVLTMVTMGLMTGAAMVATDSYKPSVLWQIVAYVIITIAEVCISVTGLELAYVAAPRTMKSFVTACWLLTVFLGNLLNIPLTRMYDDVLAPHIFFGMLTLMTAVVCAVFAIVAAWFNRASARWELEQKNKTLLADVETAVSETA
ncbi:MAG: oligopeptide:H+ symporter [Gemmatales bacterium]|nr:oligopeptide:H+ symporter [Gemmatales bacterium]MDW8386691.1 oligopeptide:H+ symporter [Gemmatales bacterium]